MLKSNYRQDGPQAGPIARASDAPAIVQAGAAPKDKGGKAAGIKLRSGTPPPGFKSGSAEKNVRSGSDPRSGAPGPSGGTAITPRSGSAPKGGMAPPGSRIPSQEENVRAKIGHSGYAKGGKVNRHGVEPKNGADAQDSDGEYAKGGKVKVIGAAGGNGGLPGGNAAIPLAQPGGTPSTGVVAGGTLPMTSDTLGTESTMKAPKLRSTAIKRSGSIPSLPRPRR